MAPWRLAARLRLSSLAAGRHRRVPLGDARKNPDTLERDHATLIVNRLDDAFAKRRWNKDSTADETADEAKCRRNVANSSTGRLFPARPSPDIDNLGGSIR